jgi:hypothetical protein
MKNRIYLRYIGNSYYSFDCWRTDIMSTSRIMSMHIFSGIFASSPINMPMYNYSIDTGVCHKQIPVKFKETI